MKYTLTSAADGIRGEFDCGNMACGIGQKEARDWAELMVKVGAGERRE